MTIEIVYTYTCDCCGKGIYDNDVYKFSGVHPELPKPVSKLGEVDICEACSIDFGKWLLGRRLSNGVSLPPATESELPA